MGVAVNAAVGVFLGFLGAVVGSTVFGSKLAPICALILGAAGFVLAGSLIPEQKEVQGESYEARQARKDAKKEKKRAAAEAEKEAEAERIAAAKAERESAKKKADKNKAKQAKKAPVVESDSEDEAEEVPQSKNAKKKAKQAAKKATEAAPAKSTNAAASAEALKKQAEKAKLKEKEAKKKEKAAVEKAQKAAALDTEGWEVQPVRQPSKKQQERAAERAVEDAASPKSSSSSGVPAQHTNLKPVTTEVVVPIKQHPIIIGPGGNTLKALSAGTGARIEMPKRETGSSKIVLSGTPDQIAAAKNAILSLAERGFSHITHPGTLSDDLAVDSKDIGAIMGSKGANLKIVQDKYHVKVNLPEKGAKHPKISIVGAKEDVKAAKVIFRQLINDGFSPLTHEGWEKREIPFPKERIGVLIGPNGQTIKSVQGNTKTKINIPDKNSANQHIVVVGLPAGVAQAEKEILRLLEPPAPLPDPEEEDIATDSAWGQSHTADGEDSLW